MSLTGGVLGLVPARAGSKGVPGKNLRLVGGKPLIAWTLEAAAACPGLDAVVVSTDSPEIAGVAATWGAEVPFLRPAEHASDTASSLSVIEHALSWLATEGRTYAYLVLLEPTSPLREPSDIASALALLEHAPAVVSVCRAETVHPAFMYLRTDDGYLKPFLSGTAGGVRRQDIAAVYYLDGTIYASRTDVLLAERTFYHARTAAYEVPKWKAPEIDDEVDLLIVEAIMRHRGIGE
jgi:CMP-N,N'-diacetyllegionaminic acid synthase